MKQDAVGKGGLGFGVWVGETGVWQRTFLTVLWPWLLSRANVASQEQTAAPWFQC